MLKKLSKKMNKKQLLEELKNQGITDKKVLNSIKKIKRELFVPKKYKDQAYENHPLPIKKNQTISQPYTVAFMLQALDLKKQDKVLEIGTGSGYNSALIQEITKTTVYTTEIIKDLVTFAKDNLKKAKIKKVKVFHYDGSKGLEKYKPYDKIIITAACPELPKNLIKQLKDKGILVAPIGSRYSQNMYKITKNKDKIKIENLGNFIFVPLTGKYGY